MKKFKEKEKPDNQSVNVALKNLKGFAKRASEHQEHGFISTGHLYLDLAITYGLSPSDEFDPNKHVGGGFPLGRIVEISGSEGSGKSSAAYRVVGNAQKQGLACLWIDAEHSFSSGLAQINGVDENELVLSTLIDDDNPEHIYCAEEIFDKICSACEAGFKVIVLDSIATLMPNLVLRNEFAEGGSPLAATASVLSKVMPKVLNYADKYGVLVILINQLREKVGFVMGSNEYTPGGRAAKHAYSVQIRLRKVMSKEKGPLYMETPRGPKLIGNQSYVYITKNRFGKPVEGDIIIPIYYEPYFPGAEDIIFNEGRKHKVIDKRLEVFKWGDFKIEGQSAFIAAVKDANKISELVEDIKKAAKANSAILPPEVLGYKANLKIVENPNAGSEELDAASVSRKRKTKDSSVQPERPVESEGWDGSDVLEE